MRKRLLAEIRTLDSPQIAHGHLITAQQQRLAFQVLFLYDMANAKDNDVSTRRVAAMRYLGITLSVGTWRKEPEREFLAILAQHLLGGEV